jgi:hypothetical protein
MRPAIVPTETKYAGCGKIPGATPVWCIDGAPSRRSNMGDEREKKLSEEPDVEAHSKKAVPDEKPEDDDDTPDVEAHRHKTL